MGAVFNRVTLSATGNTLVAEAGTNAGESGWELNFAGTGWTGSVVLKQNTAPPGATASLSTLSYFNASTGALVAAGTAITSGGSFIVSNTGLDLWLVYTHTAGTVQVTLGAAGGQFAGVTVAAGDIAAGTFGSYTGATGTYAFPSLLASTTAFATPSALAATAFNAFASAVSGAVLMGFGTTHDVALKNRAGTTVLGVGPNTTTTTLGGSLVLAGGTPATHILNLESLTLPSNCNVIRGAGINPTRTSGWISFSGTVSATPAQVYTDYRELHTTGVAEVLGFGSFPYMDAGASCASMFGHQAIAYVSTGATVLSAAGAAGTGIFAFTGKAVIDGATFTAGGVAAAAFLSFQANVTDVQAEDTSMVNMEVASGGVNAIFKFRCSAAKGATYFVNFANNAEPAEKTSAKTTAINDVVGNIKVLVGDQVGYINLHSAKAT